MVTNGSPERSKSENPYVGPRPFRTGERIYGRRQEIRRLHYLLSAERIVLLHSPSGAGKTSLIQAGLVPELTRDRFDVWPVIRVNLDPEDRETTTASSVNRYVRSVFWSLEEGLPEARRRRFHELENLSLAEYVEGRPRRPGAHASIALIFDQFEEVLTLDPVDIDQKKTFFTQLGDLLQDPRIWCLIVLRDEFIAPLDAYRNELPTRLETRFRLDLLGRDAALEAVTEPAHTAGRTFEEEAAAALIEDLATVSVQQPDGSITEAVGPSVEPVQLQVVCRRLWDQIPPGQERITRQHLDRSGNVDEALSAYYDHTLGSACGGDWSIERRLREWFDERLITPNGIRSQVVKGEEASGGLENRLVDRLLASHLVRSEKRAGATWYELAHDRLVTPVRSSNRTWLTQNLKLFQRRAVEWAKEGRPDSLLLRGPELAEAEEWHSRHPGTLLEPEKELIHRSRQYRKARFTKRIAAVAVLVTAVAVAIGTTFLKMKADREALIARTRLLISQSEAQQSGRFDIPALLAVLAYKLHPDTETRSSLLRALTRASEKLYLTLRGHDLDVVQAAWNPADQEILATGGRDKTIRLWNSASGKVLQALEGHDDFVNALAWSRDGKLASASEDHSIRVWDWQDGKVLHTLSGHDKGVYQLTWSEDSRWLASGGKDGKVIVWDAGSGIPQFSRKLHRSEVNTLVWLRGGEKWMLASGGTDGAVFVQSSGSELVAVLPAEGHTQIWRLAWRGRGRPEDAAALESGSTGSPSMGVRLSACAPLPQPSPDPSRGYPILVASGVRTTENQRIGLLRAWHVPDVPDSSTPDLRISPELVWERTEDLTGGAFGRVMISWSPDTRLLASVGGDGTLRFRDWLTGCPVQNLGQTEGGALQTGQPPGKEITSLAWNPEGRYLATGLQDGSIRLWDPLTSLPTLNMTGHEDRVNSVAWSPDGQKLASASSDKTAKIWLMPPQGLLRTLDAHDSTVSGLAWNLDSSSLVSGGWDGNVRAWEIDKETPPDTLKEPGSDSPSTHGQPVMTVATSPDGRSLASADAAGRLKIWNLLPFGFHQSFTGHQEQVSALAWSPDSRILASGSYDPKAPLRLWDRETGQSRVPAQAAESITALSWKPEGRSLAVATNGGAILLLDTEDPSSPAEQWVNGLPQVSSLAWLGGRSLAVASHDGAVRIFTDSSDQAIHTLPADETRVESLAWNPVTSMLATGGADRTVKLWEEDSERPFVVIPSHGAEIHEVSWSPDGSYLASGDEGGTIRIWKLDFDLWLERARRIVSRNLTRAEWQAHLREGIEYREVFEGLPIPEPKTQGSLLPAANLEPATPE